MVFLHRGWDDIFGVEVDKVPSEGEPLQLRLSGASQNYASGTTLATPKHYWMETKATPDIAEAFTSDRGELPESVKSLIAHAIGDEYEIEIARRGTITYETESV